MTRTIFFIIAFAVLVLLSFSSIKIFTTLLRIAEPWAKILNIFGFVFPFVIALAMTVTRFSDGILARIFYTKIMVLTGIMFYIFLGAVLLGLLLLADRFGHFDLNWQYISKIVLVCAFILSTIGIVQSFMIKTTNYTLTKEESLGNLPGKKLALIADTHLGLINRTNISKRSVDKILEIKPDAVLIAGDFFDGPDFDLEKSMAEWKRLAEQIPVFYAPGNHEEYGPYAKFISALKDSGITVLEDESINFENVEIIGLKYRSKERSEEVVSVLEKINPNKKPAILINHPPIFQKEVNGSGVFLEVSGHSHRGQLWPFGYIVKMIYGKYYYGMHKFENLTQITTSGIGTASIPMRTFNTPEVVIINFE